MEMSPKNGDFNSTEKSVVQFFNGKDVFITGATGFMGKVLIEKLLWSCRDIGDVYILLRKKKEMSLHERLKTLLDLPLFDRIRKEDPGLFAKIKPINGDIGQLNLGISAEDEAILEERVSVVFHAAASVRFDDPIKKAILLNLRATRDVMELAKRMKQLKVLTYVSTSYSNCDKDVIEEKVYSAYYDWRLMIELAETLDEHIFNILEPKLLDKKPNTYTFTKQLAENVVEYYSSDVPSIIFRPSIVVPTYEEPMSGWVDNLNGPGAFSCGVVAGVIHVIYAEKTTYSNYIPCDYAIRGLIATTWYRANLNSNECQVVNASVENNKNVTINQMIDYLNLDYKDQVTFKHTMCYPFVNITSNWYIFYTMTILTQVMPGILIDAILKALKIDFSLTKLYRRIYLANRALFYFLHKYWDITNENYKAIIKHIPIDEFETFNYDVKEIPEFAMVGISVSGYKQFILKEDMSEESLKEGRAKLKRLYAINVGLKIIFYGLMFMLVYKKFILPRAEYFKFY